MLIERALRMDFGQLLVSGWLLSPMGSLSPDDDLIWGDQWVMVTTSLDWEAAHAVTLLSMSSTQLFLLGALKMSSLSEGVLDIWLQFYYMLYSIVVAP